MDLKVLVARQDQLAMEARGMLDVATKEDRMLTADEIVKHDAILKDLDAAGRSIMRLKNDDSFMQQIDAMTRGAVDQHFDQRRAKSFGQRVIDSEAFKALADVAKRSRRIESDEIVIKAALLEDGLVPPDAVTKIVAPTHRLNVAALFAQGTTGSNAVTYNRETAFTNNAAAVSEGQPKPESDLVLAPIVEPVRKYAHWLTVSREALEDIPQMRSYLDGRLQFGLASKIDDALLNGSTTPPSLVGMLNRPIGATITQGAGESIADAALRQAAALEVASGLPADGLVINPADYYSVLTAKDDNGQYYGSGPFRTPSPSGPTLWGQLAVAVTQSIPAGTLLVGSFKNGAQMLWRETMTLSISNSHQDYFTRNLLALLIEARLALIVSLPESFGKVTLAVVTP